MSAPGERPTVSPGKAPARPLRRAAATLFARGEPMVWLSGGALALCLVMILAVLGLIAVRGLQTFWPRPLLALELRDGTRYLGEVSAQEDYASGGENSSRHHRRQLRTENHELTNSYSHWVDDAQVSAESRPPWALLIERLHGGRFYGVLQGYLRLRVLDLRAPAEIEALRQREPAITVIVEKHSTKEYLRAPLAQISLEAGDQLLYAVEETIDGAEAAWSRYLELRGGVAQRRAAARKLRRVDLGRLSAREEGARLAAVEAKLEHGENSPEHRAMSARHHRILEELSTGSAEIERELARLDGANREHALWVATADGRHKAIELGNIVRAFAPNQLSFTAKAGVYFARWWEFVSDDPRESNQEGGVLPAIFGTVVMTLLMSLVVVPFGVLAALYLREYARQGLIVSCVRIAVNNLAGVPSIVFGVFGLGFFCYGIGKYIDGGPRTLGISPWPAGVWLPILAALAALVLGAIWISARAWSSRCQRSRARQRALGRLAGLLWLAAAATLVLLLIKTPFFDGFYAAALSEGRPTFGRSGLLWASITLALLTAPVVIVATEEALAAVPSSMREGSYACGASKWQTIRRIVLPRAMPGIMTGMILAMARGAGEVAPIMLVGVAKKASRMAVDGIFPYVHPERSFMHLGFNIYDLGFQSPNSQAAIPMVFTTALVLILLVVALNLAAIWLRSRLRRRFVGAQF